MEGRRVLQARGVKPGTYCHSHPPAASSTCPWAVSIYESLGQVHVQEPPPCAGLVTCASIPSQAPDLSTGSRTRTFSRHQQQLISNNKEQTQPCRHCPFRCKACSERVARLRTQDEFLTFFQMLDLSFLRREQAGSCTGRSLMKHSRHIIKGPANNRRQQGIYSPIHLCRVSLNYPLPEQQLN